MIANHATRVLASISALLLAVTVSGCAAGRIRIAELSGNRAGASCRMPIDAAGTAAPETIAWTGPSIRGDTLDAWCRMIGPPVILPQPAHAPDEAVAPEELVVVTWNLHVGAADLGELVRRLRAGALTNGRPVDRFVLLLQEAMRSGPMVSRTAVPGVHAPRAIGIGESDRVDIVRLAQSMGLALYYVPSMRNGAPDDTEEDRGNAILSTEPLSDFEAIELPFERQRRVAIAAAIAGVNSAGVPWTLRVASAHLESSAPARRLWILATSGRTRQARGLLDALDADRPLVLAGDFNSWFGRWEPAYRTVAAALPDIGRKDGRATYAPFFRLDHMFSRVPDGWAVTTVRLDDRLGSDHYPILSRFQLPNVNAQ